MITLYGGRFHTHIDLFDWWLPATYAGTHFLKQIAATPATAQEIADHQSWGIAATEETLANYTTAGLLHMDELGRYSLDLSSLIDLLDAAWLKRPQEDYEQRWECAGELTCNGTHDHPAGKRGPAMMGDENGPVLLDETRAEVAA